MFWRGGVCPWWRRRAYPVANNEDTTSLAAPEKAIQGKVVRYSQSSSPKLVPIESQYATSY